MRKHVRVSEILNRLQSYADVDPIVLEEKAKIGTNVHECIVSECEDGFYCLTSDRARAYFDSFMMWANDNKHPKITQVPRLYCDELMITGECDGLIGGEQLVDWKCSATANKEIWNMQAHFYWYLLHVNGYELVSPMFWVNLRHDKHTFRDSKTGAIKRIEYTPKEPIVYEFTFDQKVLDKCIAEAIRYWEEKENAKCVV